MTTAQIGITIAIVVYLVAMLVIGAVCSKRNKNTDDFYLGGRKLGPFVTAMSAEASDMSSWLLMGLPGLAYLTGIADAGWTAIGLAIGTYVNWLIVAKRIRTYSHVAGNSITIPDFFHNRYRDKSCSLMCIAAVVIIIFFIPYTASGFAACGKLFASLFNVDYQVAMIISAVVIVGYTATGGFLAASTTDFIQSIIMSIALLAVLGFGVSVAGGFGAVIQNAQEIPGYLSMTLTHNVEENAAQPYGTLNIFSMLAWGLGYFGMPHILLRFMAIEDKNKLKLSRRVASGWVVISLFVGVLIGVVGIAMTDVYALSPKASATSSDHSRALFAMLPSEVSKRLSLSTTSMAIWIAFLPTDNICFPTYPKASPLRVLPTFPQVVSMPETSFFMFSNSFFIELICFLMSSVSAVKTIFNSSIVDCSAT